MLTVKMCNYYHKHVRAMYRLRIVFPSKWLNLCSHGHGAHVKTTRLNYLHATLLPIWKFCFPAKEWNIKNSTESCVNKTETNDNASVLHVCVFCVHECHWILLWHDVDAWSTQTFQFMCNVHKQFLSCWYSARLPWRAFEGDS